MENDFFSLLVCIFLIYMQNARDDMFLQMLIFDIYVFSVCTFPQMFLVCLERLF